VRRAERREAERESRDDGERPWDLVEEVAHGNPETSAVGRIFWVGPRSSILLRP
jgi:hypothetical protein